MAPADPDIACPNASQLRVSHSLRLVKRHVQRQLAYFSDTSCILVSVCLAVLLMSYLWRNDAIRSAFVPAWHAACMWYNYCQDPLRLQSPMGRRLRLSLLKWWHRYFCRFCVGRGDESWLLSDYGQGHAESRNRQAAVSKYGESLSIFHNLLTAFLEKLTSDLRLFLWLYSLRPMLSCPCLKLAKFCPSLPHAPIKPIRRIFLVPSTAWHSAS